MAYVKAKEAAPPSVNKKVEEWDNFKGVDFYNSPSNMSKSRSPAAPNMIRDEVGKVRKRMGYYQVGETYPARINGIYVLEDKRLVHSGTKLYLDGEEIYSGLSDNRGKSWQINGKLYIVDGKGLVCFGDFGDADTPDFEVKPVSEIAYVPTIAIAKSPTSLEFTAYESINLLSNKWTESFAGTADAEEYQLLYDELDDTEVEAKKLNADGDWVTLTEGTDFTVDREMGIVKFNTAPGETPVMSDDNVVITASRDWGDYADKVNKCSISALYGANGQSDRLFISGNEEYPNYVWYSQFQDPTYFGDDWYLTIGQAVSSVVGFSIVSDCLAVHKDYSEDGRNVVLFRDSEDEKGETVFRIINTIQGEPAKGSFTFAYVGESLFATPLGIYAITARDITGEKYTQRRSFYIDKVLANDDLANSYAVAYKDYYVISTGERIYLLDTLQKNYEKNAPYSSYQYECYYFEIPDARVLYVEDNVLGFGTDDGKVMMFYDSPNSITSYNDEGRPIEAYWEIPDFSGRLFYKNKSFTRFACVIAASVSTGVTAYALVRGFWQRIYNSGATARYFDINYLDFEKLSFSSDTTPRTLASRIKIRKVDKIRLRLENKEFNESFGLYRVALEYTETSNFKG